MAEPLKGIQLVTEGDEIVISLMQGDQLIEMLRRPKGKDTAFLLTQFMCLATPFLDKDG